MTPTLFGRIQTRLIVVIAVGFTWSFFASPFLSLFGGTVGATYGATFLAIILTAVFGAVIWEPIYHLIQQYRWEKDWPTGLGLVTMFNEGILVFLVLRAMVAVNGFVFFLHFTSTWLLIWFVLNGPIRVLLPRWRFRGGRLI